jgi:hypothetical protein
LTRTVTLPPVIDESALATLLNQRYGFAVPAPFVRMVWRAYEPARGAGHVNERVFNDYIDAVFEWGGPIADLAVQYGPRPATPFPRYATSPPELLLFGSPGEDGVHYGFVVHAPELNPPDVPLGEFTPMDTANGVTKLGDDTRSGMAYLLSRRLHWLAQDYEPDDRSRLRRERQLATIAADLGIAPSAADGDRAPVTIAPTVPAGWRYEAASDGVGVLAPAEAFSPDRRDLACLPDGSDTIEQDATRMLDAGRPASALLRIREGFWLDKYEEGLFATIKPVWARAYRDLGRPLLARALDFRQP